MGLIFCAACSSNEEESVPPPIQPSELLPPLNVSEASPQTALQVLLNENLPGSQDDSDINTVIRMPQKAFSEEDIAQVLPALSQAAEGGTANAQYILGMCDYLGRGTPHAPKEAVRWFQKAADQDEPQSQCMLGICYYYGQGVASDVEKAFSWFQKAADQDIILAQFGLGMCYYDGTGVAQDRTLALKYFKQAADRGHQQAQYMVSSLSDEVAEQGHATVSMDKISAP
ncbi:MAG: tetratricopeptide repeat protein [Thermoguttaceae bacterium]|nr:tetratricopeptide repeat protein [Thermoguttaceae bacterium]